MTEEERFDTIRHSCPGAGACGGMYTANTMASAIEALGMSLPYSSSIPAEDPLKVDECRMVGRCEQKGGQSGAVQVPVLRGRAGQGRRASHVSVCVCWHSTVCTPTRVGTRQPALATACVGGTARSRAHKTTCVHMPPVLPAPVVCVLHRYILELLKADLKPRDIMTYKAFENAMVTVMATGAACGNRAL